jgi:hypothetical protein
MDGNRARCWRIIKKHDNGDECFNAGTDMCRISSPDEPVRMGYLDAHAPCFM